MAHGLRVWDESGGLMIDYIDRLGRANSTISIGGLLPRTGVTVSAPGFTGDGTWFYCTDNIAYAEVRAQEGSFYVFNASYYVATGGFSIYIFRG
jgi:glucan-binding YG repeat protein